MSCVVVILTTLLLLCGVVVDGQTRPPPTVEITPISMEKLNPRLTEFRRIDTNDDDQVTFSEFLLGDRSYIEEQSRYFHGLDLNGDGRVTRKEFEDYFRKRDEERERRRVQNSGASEGFFKQLGTEIFDPEESSHLSKNGPPPFLFHFSPQQLFGSSRQPPPPPSPPNGSGQRRPEPPPTPQPRF